MKRAVVLAAVLVLGLAGFAYAALAPGDRVQIGGRDGTVVSTWDDGDYVVVHLDPTATPTATATATETATATPTETATPAPPTGDQFPNESTTGTPAGWTPTTTRSTSMTVNTAGTVVQDVRFTNGAKLNINAANVTVRRSEFQGGWISTSSPGVVIEDTTFDRLAPETNGGEAVMSYCGYTARRVKILNRSEGFRESGCSASTPTTIEDSFDQITPPAVCTDWHGDGIQAYHGTNLHVDNVTIDFRGNPASCGGNAPFFYPGGVDNPNGRATVNRLLVKGGGFSFRMGVPGSVQGLRIVDGAWWYGATQVYSSDGAGCAFINPWEAEIVTADANWKVTTVRDLPCRNS